MEITTKTGYKCNVYDGAEDDIELIEIVGRIDSGDISAMPEMIEKLVGKDGKKKLYDHCRNKKGIALASKVEKEIEDILLKLGEDPKKE